MKRPGGSSIPINEWMVIRQPEVEDNGPDYGVNKTTGGLAVCEITRQFQSLREFPCWRWLVKHLALTRMALR
jgi:hypothetical protein